MKVTTLPQLWPKHDRNFVLKNDIGLAKGVPYQKQRGNEQSPANEALGVICRL